jgi:hypothetical protein
MTDLTKKILEEEREKYFPKITFKKNIAHIGSSEQIIVHLTIEVFPSYLESQENKEGNDSIRERPIGEAMNKYLTQMFGLAYDMTDSREAILEMLPKDFYLKVTERLK